MVADNGSIAADCIVARSRAAGSCGASIWLSRICWNSRAVSVLEVSDAVFVGAFAAARWDRDGVVADWVRVGCWGRIILSCSANKSKLSLMGFPVSNDTGNALGPPIVEVENEDPGA